MNSTVRNGGGERAATGSGLARDAESHPGGGDPKNTSLFSHLTRCNEPASANRHYCSNDYSYAALPHAGSITFSGETRAGGPGPTPCRRPAAPGSDAGKGLR